jgi:hypothetical protein
MKLRAKPYLVLLAFFLLSAILAAQDHRSGCDTATGSKFNTEPASGAPEIGFVVPKSNPSVDFIPGGGIDGSDLVVGGAWDFQGRFNDYLTDPNNPQPIPNAWGYAQSGYYVHREGTGCGADFSGPLPPIPGHEQLLAFNQTSITVDSTRKLVYAADVRIWPFTTGGTGLLKTTAANLNNPKTCPSGTHNNDANGNPTVAEQCWPVRVLIGPASSDSGNDQPDIRADERASGTGAGDLYLAYFVEGGFGAINLVVCPYTFGSAADCSTPMTVSAGEFGPSFPHIAVRPDGVMTLTYTTHSFNGFSQDIKYLSCVPNGAPKAPTCSQATLVTTEEQPIADTLNTAAHFWFLYTAPRHDYRLNSATGGYEEFVTWARCKVPFIIPVGDPANGNNFDQCPDADVVMSYSATDKAGNPLGWSPVLPVNTEPLDQIMPSLQVDHRTNIVHIVYYTSQWDPPGELVWLVENQIQPNSYAAGPIRRLTTASIDQSVDFANGNGDFVDLGVGVRIGVAARDGRTYVHFIGTNFPGNLGGGPVSHQTNQLTRADSTASGRTGEKQ